MRKVLLFIVLAMCVSCTSIKYIDTKMPLNINHDQMIGQFQYGSRNAYYKLSLRTDSNFHFIMSAGEFIGAECYGKWKIANDKIYFFVTEDEFSMWRPISSVATYLDTLGAAEIITPDMLKMNLNVLGKYNYERFNPMRLRWETDDSPGRNIIPLKRILNSRTQ